MADAAAAAANDDGGAADGGIDCAVTATPPSLVWVDEAIRSPPPPPQAYASHTLAAAAPPLPSRISMCLRRRLCAALARLPQARRPKAVGDASDRSAWEHATWPAAALCAPRTIDAVGALVAAAPRAALLYLVLAQPPERCAAAQEARAAWAALLEGLSRGGGGGSGGEEEREGGGDATRDVARAEAWHEALGHLAAALPPPSLFALLAAVPGGAALPPNEAEALRRASLAADAARALRDVLSGLARDEWAERDGLDADGASFAGAVGPI